MSTRKKKNLPKPFSGKYAYFAKLTCESKTQPVRVGKAVLAVMCVLSAFMTHAQRLPGRIAFSKSLALASKLAKTCESFLDFASIVNGSVFAGSLQVVSVHDVAPHDKGHMLQNTPRFLEDSTPMHSFILREEADSQIIERMQVGWVGILLSNIRAEAFVKKQNNRFDCISLKHSGKWEARTGCQITSLLDDADRGAELIILNKKGDTFI